MGQLKGGPSARPSSNPNVRAVLLGPDREQGKGMNKRKRVAIAKHRHKKRKLKARAQAAR